MIVIENFLNNIEFQRIKQSVLNRYFDWYYQPSKVSDNDGGQQFTHMFLSEDGKMSNFFYILKPIFSKLKAKDIIRAKINLTHRKETIKKFQYHIDTDKECKTAILYLNTNNGKTVFKNNKQINSIENRMVIFPSNLQHTGTTHTDKDFRIVLNINYKDD